MFMNSEERMTLRSFAQTITQLLQRHLRVITRPGPQTMSEEMERASWGKVGLQLVMYVVALVILATLFNLPDIIHEVQLSGLRIDFLLPTFSTLLFTTSPFLFPLIGTIILYGVARLLGGQGNFLYFLYTNFLFLLPLLLIWGIFQAMPSSWPGVVGTIIIVYALVLRIFTLMAVQRFSEGKAAICVLILTAISAPLMLLTSNFFF